MYNLKVYSIHDTLRSNAIVKKNSFEQNKRYKNMHFYTFASSKSSQFYF